MNATQKQKTIMVVEDERDLRSVLVLALEQEGYAVVQANHGQAALDVLETGNLPDLILLDLKMPVKDGYLFRLEQTAEPRWSAIPVVTMTADRDFTDRLERLGCTDFLRKPIELPELFAVVAKYCG